MSHGSRTLFSRLRAWRPRRGLWLALSLLVLAVQTTLPAHQDSHPLGEPDYACHYCVLGGHLTGTPTVDLPLPLSAARMEAPLPAAPRPVHFRQPPTRYSRGPPSLSVA